MADARPNGESVDGLYIMTTVVDATSAVIDIRHESCIKDGRGRVPLSWADILSAIVSLAAILFTFIAAPVGLVAITFGIVVDVVTVEKRSYRCRDGKAALVARCKYLGPPQVCQY